MTPHLVQQGLGLVVPGIDRAIRTPSVDLLAQHIGMEDKEPSGTRETLEGTQAAVVRVVPQPQCGVRSAAGAD